MPTQNAWIGLGLTPEAANPEPGLPASQCSPYVLNKYSRIHVAQPQEY